MIWFGLIWNVGLMVLFFVDPHPHLDKTHCVVDQASFTQVCFPRDRCWLDADGNAECWRVAKLVYK